MINKKTNYILLFLVTISFWACLNTNKKIKEEDICSSLVLSTEKRMDSLRFEEIVDTINFVRLETNSESLFGDITKLDILDDTIVIFDRNNQLILTFDITGKFLGKIGKIGKKSDEVLNCRSMAIDKKKHEVLILDDKKLRIFHFNLNGRFIFSKEAKVYPYEFCSKDNQLIYYREKSPSFFGKKVEFDLLITKNNEILQKYFPFSKTVSFRYPLNRVLYELNDTVCVIDKWNSRVYSIIGGELQQRFCIDFMGNEIPLEFTKEEKVFYSNSKKYSYLYDYLVENDFHIYFRYLRKGVLQKVIYNKKRKSYYTFSANNVNQNLISFSFAPIYSYDNSFVSLLQPDFLIKAAGTNMFIKNDIKKLASEISLNDNVILLFCKLKD